MSPLLWLDVGEVEFYGRYQRGSPVGKRLGSPCGAGVAEVWLEDDSYMLSKLK